MKKHKIFIKNLLIPWTNYIVEDSKWIIQYAKCSVVQYVQFGLQYVVKFSILLHCI